MMMRRPIDWTWFVFVLLLIGGGLGLLYGMLYYANGR